MASHQYNDACLVVVLLALAHEFEDYSMLRIRNALKEATALSAPQEAILAETGTISAA